jgi:hypothetical protein
VQRTLNTHVHVRSHDSDFEWQTNQRLHLGTGYGGLSILASKTADNAPEDPTQVGCNCNTNYAGTQVRVSCLLGADLPAPNSYVYSGTLKIWSGSNGLTPYKHANTSTVLRLLAEFDQFFFFFFFFSQGLLRILRGQRLRACCSPRWSCHIRTLIGATNHYLACIFRWSIHGYGQPTNSVQFGLRKASDERVVLLVFNLSGRMRDYWLPVNISPGRALLERGQHDVCVHWCFEFVPPSCFCFASNAHGVCSFLFFH